MSKVTKRFADYCDRVTQDSSLPTGVFPERCDDRALAQLPAPLAEYYCQCGFEGIPLPRWLWARYVDATLRQAPGRVLTVDYTHLDTAYVPQRLAYISAHLFGIPFEGLDVLTADEQSMSGFLGGHLRLFQQRSQALRQGNLHSLLSEVLIFPTLAWAPWLQWQQVDDVVITATIDPAHPAVVGHQVSGEFTFTPDGGTAQYHTTARAQVTGSGIEFTPWTAKATAFGSQLGYRLPAALSAIWHEEDGPVEYFTGNNLTVAFG